MEQKSALIFFMCECAPLSPSFDRLHCRLRHCALTQRYIHQIALLKLNYLMIYSAFEGRTSQVFCLYNATSPAEYFNESLRCSATLDPDPHGNRPLYGLSSAVVTNDGRLAVS